MKDNSDQMTITSSSQSWPKMNMSIFEYQSGNYYWIQQRYYYQCGGVFLSQDNGSINRISPSLSIVNNSDSTVAVYITPVRLSGSSSIGGSGPVRVDTRLRPMNPSQMQLNTFVNISVDVADKPTALMWMNSVFNESRLRGGLTNPASYSFGVSENAVTRRATAFINITGPVGGSTNDVYLTVRPVEYVITLNTITSGLT